MTEYKHVKLKPSAYEALVSEAERRYSTKNDITWSALVKQLVAEAQNNEQLREPTIEYEV